MQRHNAKLQRHNAKLQRHNAKLQSRQTLGSAFCSVLWLPSSIQEDRAMALWSSGVTWSSGTLWGPVPTPPAPGYANTPHKHKHMRRDNYYPRRLAERPEWHINFAAKIQIHGPALNLTATQINNAVADNLTLAYGLGDWLTNVRDLGPTATASLKLLNNGTGTTPYVFPTYTVATPPTLPAGITSVQPGALGRTFLLIHEIKGKATYTEPMGLDMGIVGSEAPPPPPGASTPRITVTAVQGADSQFLRIKFFKDKHEGIYAEVRRGGGPWEPLPVSTESPLNDTRPLLVPGQAEVREVRARFWDKGQSNGDWCDVAKVTVSP